MGKLIKNEAKSSLSREFYAAGEQQLALPAPSTSLHTPAISPVVRDVLTTHNNVYFGEWHDDVNDKFLADNPEIFREAKAQGANKIFVELNTNYAPLYKAYYDGKVSDDEFKKQLTAFNSEGSFTSGDSAESMTTQMAAMAKTSKAEGVRALPSDFRNLDPNQRGNLPVNYTSAAYGIPDVQGLNDSVQHQTQLSLEEYKKLYSDKTGSDLPVTLSQQKDFKYLHAFRLDALSDEEKDQFKKDLDVRAEEFRKDAPSGNLHYQNQLQFNYVAMVTEPNEKRMFMGGRNHIMLHGNTAEVLETNGYGTTGSVQLLSNGGILHDKAAYIDGMLPLNEALPKPFDYKVQTQTGEVLKGNGNKVEVPTATIQPAVAPTLKEPTPTAP